MTNDIEIINYGREFFARNKDFTLFHAILKGNKERMIFLNKYHNTVEVYYANGKTIHPMRSAHTYGPDEEGWGVEFFGASYEVLDALFEKYKTNELAINKFVDFCLRSKSKSYWRYRLKDTPLGKEIMAKVLGAAE